MAFLRAGGGNLAAGGALRASAADSAKPAASRLYGACPKILPLQSVGSLRSVANRANAASCFDARAREAPSPFLLRPNMLSEWTLEIAIVGLAAATALEMWLIFSI